MGSATSPGLPLSAHPQPSNTIALCAPNNTVELMRHPGCIGCRLRRKKCSGEKPKCVNCVRNCILCTWPEPGNSKHAALLRRTNPTRKKRQAENSLSPQASQTVLVPAARLAHDDDSEGWPSSMLTEVPRPLELQLLREKMALPVSRRLFHYYVHRANKVMATFQGSKNPFISELVPMALSNDSILDSLLAYSGIHYADHAGVPADETTWIHYGQAVQAQKFGLTWLAQGNDHVLVPLLVTAMLLCIAETFRENSGRLALYHLRALSALIQKALRLPEPQLPKDTRAFLIERYMYTMTLAHITMGSESDEWVLNDGNILYPMLESSPIHALFKLIPRVSVLARHWAAETQTGSVSDSLLIEKEELHTLVSSWEPNSREINYTLCGIVYQQALLVYLASIPEGNREALAGYPDTVQELFDTFLPFLMSTPPESPISTMLCWPLAIFGSCAADGEHRRVIHERLQLLSQIYSAQSVRDTMILLEKMWAETPGPSSPLSFERIMKREGMTVLFF